MSTNTKKSLFNFFKKRKVKRFSLFVIIAFVFLIFSKLSNDYKQIINLKLQLVNTADEIVIKQDSSMVFEALIEAKGFALLPYVFKNEKIVIVDANTNVTVTNSSYIFDVQRNTYLVEDQFGSSYKLLDINPDTLIIPFSKKAYKYVPIKLLTDIEFMPGFDKEGDFILSSDSVKIVGPESKVNTIQYVETNILKLKNVNSKIENNVELKKIEDLELFPGNIDVKAQVKRFTEGTIKIPVKIIGLPNNETINFFPKVVTVSYYVDLERYNAITKNDFEVICDYRNISNEKTYLVPQITKSPSFIKRLNIKQKRIDFIKL